MSDNLELTEKEKYLNGIVQIQERYITELIRSKINSELQTKAYDELVGNLNVQQQNLQKRNEELENLIKQSTTSITALTEENEKLRQLGDDRINIINCLKNDLDELKVLCEQLQSVNSSQEREIVRLNSEVLTVSHRNNELEQQAKAFAANQMDNQLDETSFVKKQRPKTKRQAAEDRNEPLTMEVDPNNF